jgi:AAA15 family ATPase/GTPase
MNSLPRNYSIKNFKAFGEQNNQVPLRPITLVFGANSAGKSSLLHSLIWINEALRSKSFDFRFPDLGGKSIDLGYFSQMIHGHDLTKRIAVDMTFTPDQFSDESNSFFNLDNGIKVSFTIGKRFKANISEPTLLDCRLESMNGKVFLSLIRNSNPELAVSNLDSLHSFLSNHPTYFREYEIASKFLSSYSAVLNGVILDEVVDILPGQFQFYANDSSESLTGDYETDVFWEKILPKSIENLFSEINKLILNSIGAMEYVPPLRELPPRYFNYVESDHLWTRVFDDKILSKKVNTWLQGSRIVDSPKQTNAGYELIFSTFYSTALLEREMPLYAHEQMAGALLNEKANRSDMAAQVAILYDKLKDDFFEANPWYLREHQDLVKAITEKELERDPDGYQKKYEDEFFFEKIEEAVTLEVIGERYLTRELLEDESSYVAELYRRWLAEQEEVIDVMNQYSTAQETAEFLLNRKYSGSMQYDQYVNSEYVRREIQLRDLRTNVRVSLQDIGVGVSQVLPVILQAYGSKNKLIAIEQPEIHLHPRLQSDLADVFIESALGENQNSFLLETHSEHLILRLLRRIRETTNEDFSDWPEDLKKACPNGIRPQDVAVLYVKPGEEGAEVIELPITPDGDFTCPWPSGFFTERSRELF